MNEWQPIETAPTDGTKVLGWWPEWGSCVKDNENDCAVTTWFDGLWQNPFEHGYLPGEEGAPTHWMPLPEAPD